ncbi:MAG: hypothetical protein GY820_11620 [Gammaproteobacteria bacterium]|nr:hypothetical protein [Gammaproteobacteria bacterium]
MQLTGSRGADVLQPYDGDSDFDDWLSLFLRVKEAYNWNDAKALRILPAYLRGNAADLYAELTADQKSTLEELTTNLRSALEPDEMARITQNKLVKRRMRPYETIVEFAAEIQRLVKSAYRKLPAEVQATLMRDHFIEKVIPEIKRYLLLLDPQDFATAKRKAMQIETQYNSVIEKDEEEVSTERKRGDKKHRILATHVEKDDLKTMMAEILKELRSKNDWTNPVDYNERRSSPQGWNNNQNRRSSPQFRGRNPSGFQRTPRAQYSWRNANREYDQRSTFRSQGTPSGRIVCYKCGKYNHTAAVCNQNRGRNFGGSQPFWRSQNTTENILPIEQATPTAINGHRTSYVYQLMPVTTQTPQYTTPLHQDIHGEWTTPQMSGYLEVEQQNSVVCMLNPDSDKHSDNTINSNDETNSELNIGQQITTEMTSLLSSDPTLLSMTMECDEQCFMDTEYSEMSHADEMHGCNERDQATLPEMETLQQRCNHLVDYLKSIQQQLMYTEAHQPTTDVATHAIIQDQGIPTANSLTEHTVDYEEDMELALNYVREHQVVPYKASPGISGARTFKTWKQRT